MAKTLVMDGVFRSMVTAPIGQDIEVRTWNEKTIVARRADLHGYWTINGRQAHDLLPVGWRPRREASV